MPAAGKVWRHVVISTHCSWLPGDPRGFRTFRHKRHSSGDYKNPPPEEEHAGLHRHAKNLAGEAIIIPREARQRVGEVILNYCEEKEVQILVLAVSGMHCHFQAELPESLTETRRVVGEIKKKCSHAIRDVLPGRIWARDGKYKIIDSPEYQRKVFGYILGQKSAWIWSYKQR